MNILIIAQIIQIVALAVGVLVQLVRLILDLVAKAKKDRQHS